MLTRRQLLARGTTLLVLAPVIPVVLHACSSSDDGTGPDTPPTGDTCAGSAPLSTANAGHKHSVCVPTSDMTSPPAAGMTYTSSNDGNHTHQIKLTQAQLKSIADGNAVTVTSTSDIDPINGTAHTHDWTITKAKTSTPTPPPPSGW